MDSNDNTLEAVLKTRVEGLGDIDAYVARMETASKAEQKYVKWLRVSAETQQQVNDLRNAAASTSSGSGSSPSTTAKALASMASAPGGGVSDGEMSRYRQFIEASRGTANGGAGSSDLISKLTKGIGSAASGGGFTSLLSTVGAGLPVVGPLMLLGEAATFAVKKLEEMGERTQKTSQSIQAATLANGGNTASAVAST